MMYILSRGMFMLRVVPGLEAKRRGRCSNHGRYLTQALTVSVDVFPLIRPLDHVPLDVLAAANGVEPTDTTALYAYTTRQWVAQNGAERIINSSAAVCGPPVVLASRSLSWVDDHDDDDDDH